MGALVQLGVGRFDLRPALGCRVPQESLHLRLGGCPLFTELPRETVRKGCEQRSEREFGHYTEHKMAQEATPMRPLRLRWERLQDFSDSLSRILGE